ncbi:MAG: hypothetical protein ACI9FU_001272 [Granulosicoccus sp.]|jgi:hypothetical protein
MAIYKFKVTIDEDEEITRDIEVRSAQGFSTLHNAIVQHFKFRKDQPVSYFSSDQQWYEGDLIIELDANSKDTKRLAAFIYDPHQRFICVTESYNEVALAIELIKVSKEVDGVDYPRCVGQTGESPYYTQPPLQHIPDEDEEPNVADMLLEGDEPSDDELMAAESEAEQVDVKMPDMSELFNEMAKDDGKSSEQEEEKGDEEKTDDSHADFNVDDLI